MIKTRIEQVINVNDWNDLVITTYGKPYNFQQQDGCKVRQRVRLSIPDLDAEEFDFENDTVPETVNGPEMGVSFKAWLARDPRQKLNAEAWYSAAALPMWWDRNFYPCIEMVANDLHAKGLIEAGEYSIDIDW